LRGVAEQQSFFQNYYMEVKIIDPTNQTDIDFIKNNPQFKQDFEDLASWYRENKKNLLKKY
jgi:hypothetical protein